MGRDIITLYYPKFERNKYKTVHININYEDFIFDEDNRQYEPTIFEYTLETMKLVAFDHCYKKIDSEDFYDFLEEIDKTQKEIEEFLSSQKEKSRRVIDFFVEKEETFGKLSNKFRELVNGRPR